MNRWQRHLIAGIAAAVLATAAVALWLGWSGAPQRADYFVFGSVSSVELRGAHGAQGRVALDRIGELLQRDESDWHPWQSSQLTRLNTAIARGERFAANSNLAGLIHSAQRGYVDSGGLFNPAIGRLIGLWGFHTSDYPLLTPRPDKAQIQSLLAAAPRMDQIELSADGSVIAHNPAIELDLNGLAEGYAAEQIAALLRERGIDNALISIGGDVLALGNADGRAWRVAISSPQHRVLASVELSGREALFSSGDYNKYRQIDGQRWPHVLDPRTGEPARGVAAASVIHANAVRADIAATTLMIAGAANFARITQRLGVGCALLLTDNGDLWITAAMRERLQFESVPTSAHVIAAQAPGCATLALQDPPAQEGNATNE